LLEGSQLITRAEELGTNWVRVNHQVSWRELQPNEGDPIDWSKMASFENALMAMKARGMTPVVIINDSPDWAVKPYYKDGEWNLTSCAAIKSEKFIAFASFVGQVVDRYSAPEFDVHHWEMGNEVDVDPTLLHEPDSFYGCWGDKEDPFYGGRHYGEMLKVVSPVIKYQDPSAKVWIGGLLLDNPNTKPHLGSMGQFLAGILEAGAAPHFDILPYHAYIGWNGLQVDQDIETDNVHWYPWGGMVLGKAKFLRQTLARYEVDKPLFVNEFALNCPEYTTACLQIDDAFLQIQADQLVRSFARGWANQIQGFTWYTLQNGWRDGGLLDNNKDPRPSFITYQHFLGILSEARYYAPWNYGSEVEAYRFDRGDAYIDVVWSKANQTHTVTFPKTSFLEARDRDGASLTPLDVAGSYQLPVGFSPVYLVFDR
jgi:hypothetical protein